MRIHRKKPDGSDMSFMEELWLVNDRLNRIGNAIIRSKITPYVPFALAFLFNTGIGDGVPPLVSGFAGFILLPLEIPFIIIFLWWAGIIGRGRSEVPVEQPKPPRPMGEILGGLDASGRFGKQPENIPVHVPARKKPKWAVPNEYDAMVGFFMVVSALLISMDEPSLGKFATSLVANTFSIWELDLFVVMRIGMIFWGHVEYDLADRQ